MVLLVPTERNGGQGEWQVETGRWKENRERAKGEVRQVGAELGLRESDLVC